MLSFLLPKSKAFDEGVRVIAHPASQRKACQILGVPPPGESKHKEVRYLDIHEDDQLDEAHLATWIRLTKPLF